MIIDMPVRFGHNGELGCADCIFLTKNVLQILISSAGSHNKLLLRRSNLNMIDFPLPSSMS
ncbi:unnamed protein product, partial [Hymenolepis diminuta]